MKKYWDQHSQAGSIEEMMLDDDASKIEVQDREEILSLQPALKGKRVLELAAGIGRFTPYLAERVGPEGCVTAVEFIQAFSDQNESSHRHLGNTSFVCADVTKLEQPEGSVDVIFINWLLMYLGDDEVACARAGLLFSRHLLLLALPFTLAEPGLMPAVGQGVRTQRAEVARAGWPSLLPRVVLAAVGE